MNNQNMIDTVTRISGVNPRKCMRCGKCSASCPAYDEMELIFLWIFGWWPDLGSGCLGQPLRLL